VLCVDTRTLVLVHRYLFVTHQPVDYTKQLAEAAKQMCKRTTITKVSNAKVNLSVHRQRSRYKIEWEGMSQFWKTRCAIDKHTHIHTHKGLQPARDINLSTHIRYRHRQIGEFTNYKVRVHCGPRSSHVSRLTQTTCNSSVPDPISA